jgi:hypothetical protein
MNDHEIDNVAGVGIGSKFGKGCGEVRIGHSFAPKRWSRRRTC